MLQDGAELRIYQKCCEVRTSCELTIVKATASVPNAHFSSAFCWLLPPLAPPLAQQGLVGQRRMFSAADTSRSQNLDMGVGDE
ncbi:hypothetical protein HaLaN_28399 [Haematococcus lacustris]|uniref:Uncharacterized protein n=1 Tax=Haematococcus lacustris TaxID=44745 RepID=A0A6A0ABK5_HAELA|nr:hypothetical protein HaLaN_28399 [Haematococcus lacustris]